MSTKKRTAKIEKKSLFVFDSKKGKNAKNHTDTTTVTHTVTTTGITKRH